MIVNGNTEQSVHWDERQGLPPLDSGFHDCYPCREGMPHFPWRSASDDNALFEIVTAWGHRAEAWVDDSNEFMAAGVQWVIIEDQHTRTINQIQVAAWRRIPGRSVPSLVPRLF